MTKVSANLKIMGDQASSIRRAFAKALVDFSAIQPERPRPLDGCCIGIG